MTWAPATIAVVLIGYATVSRRLERLNVSGAMFFTTAGLLVGPVLGLLDLQVRGEQVKLLAEVTLTLVLFADAARISLPALRHEYAVPLRLLGIGLPLTILAGAVAGAVVVPGVSFAEALVLAVVLACTDAALGQAVVAGVAAGVLGGLALRYSTRHRLIEPHWAQILSAAAALLAAGIATAIGGSIFIAAFSGGFLFGTLRHG